MVLLGNPPDRGFVGAVVDAEGLLLVGGHVRMDPRDPIGAVRVDDQAAGSGAFVVRRNDEAVRERALDHKSRHVLPSMKAGAALVRTSSGRTYRASALRDLSSCL